MFWSRSPFLCAEACGRTSVTQQKQAMATPMSGTVGPDHSPVIQSRKTIAAPIATPVQPSQRPADPANFSSSGPTASTAWLSNTLSMLATVMTVPAEGQHTIDNTCQRKDHFAGVVGFQRCEQRP